MRLLERDQPLVQLHSLLDSAAGGEGSVALVRGEAGIGKTSLVRSFIGEIDGRAHVLVGLCDDLVTARPFGPLRDMARSEPEVQTALEDEDRAAVYAASLELFSRSLRPTVMVIEDVHWADEGTLDLVRFLGRRVESTHGLLILTFRDEVGSVGEQVRLVIGDLPADAVTRIRLGPLSTDAVRGLAGTEDVAELMGLTGGNPFLVTELLASEEEVVPESILDAVGSRLSRLSEPARELGELVSVVPGRAEIALLTKLFGELKAPLAEAERSGLLLVEGSAVRFRHELARRAVEADLGESVRVGLNSRVLAALEAEGADPSRLAHHARAAGDVQAMLRILPAAAKHASAAGSDREALEHLDAMEPHLEELGVDELADHYDFWAGAAYRQADGRAFDLAREAIRLRRQVGEPVALGKSLLAGGVIAWANTSAVIPRAEIVEEALALLESSPAEDLASAHAMAAKLSLISYDFERTLEYARKTLAIDNAPPQARAEALGCIGWVLATTSFPDGIAEMEESYHVSESAGLHQEQTRAASNLAARYAAQRMPAEARVWAERGLTIARARLLPLAELALSSHLIWVEEITGDWERAEAMAESLLDSATSHLSFSMSIRTEIARIRVRQGAPNALQMTVGLWEEARVEANPMQIGPVSWPVQDRMWLAGDIPDEVAEDLIVLMNAVFDNDELINAGELAFYLYLAGHIPELPEKTPDPFRALVNGDWEEAASFWEGRGCPYEHALALSFGDVEARIAALRILDGLGAVPLATRIRRGLQAEGVKGIPRGPYKGRRASGLGLTPRQTEILELLGEGMSNVEIADRLFLSVRTVEQHVSAILTTLGVSSREEAGRHATQAKDLV